MSYRALTFYLLSIAVALGILRLLERPQGDTGAAIAANLRARFLAEFALLIASFLVYLPWIWVVGDSSYAIIGGLVLAHAVGILVWWLVRALTLPPPPPPIAL